jgi:AbrB family looped-hinge helix DNA binding protein
MKNKVVIDNVEYFSDVIKSNPKISHKATSFIGGFPAKTCEFEILNLDGSLSLNNKEITVYKGLHINGSDEWVKMGIFKAKDGDITTNLSTKSISFKGTDRRTLFDESYYSELQYPATGLQIIQDICNTLGVTLETTNFNMANYTWTKKPNFSEATTFTEAVARMAEAGGEIAYISRDGGLRIVGQTKTGQTIPKSKRKSLTKEKQFGAINTIVLGMAGYDDDIVYPNNIMINTGIGKNKLDISKYEKTSYHQGDFVLNGDTLKITVNNVYSAINNFIVQYTMQLKPNTKYTFSWNCNKSNNAQAARWYFYADKLWGSKSLGSGAENGASRTITTDETGLVVAGLYITTSVVVGDTITISNLQLEEGSSKTSYEEGKAAGIIEWKITNNPYFDLNREEIVETIANNIIGKSVIPYSINDFVDDFIYDLNDVVSVIDNNGKILIPEEIRKKLKINKGDILEIMATDNIIVIEKFEGDLDEI